MQKTRRGLLISFDGIDSSGKETQAQLLAERLRYLGHTVRELSTPDYSTPTGQELKARLQGKKGDWKAWPWEKKMHLFAENRAEHKEEVMAALHAGDLVVYDRYVPSSLAFMVVEAAPKQTAGLYRQEIQHTVARLEYQTHGMPKEDLAIFLDVPPRISAAMLERRKEKLKDESEYTDHLHVQEHLYNEYDLLCRSNPKHFLRIRCVEGGELLGIADIAELLWEALLGSHPELEK